MQMTWSGLAAASLLALGVAGCSSEPELDPAQTGTGENTIELAEFPDRPYWGDTHLHTKYSADAFLNGNLDAGPAEAYRFAKGEPIIHPLHRARVVDLVQ